MAGAKLSQFLDAGFLAIARNIPVEKLPDVAQAVWEGGVRFFEVTFDQSREDAQELLSRSMKAVYDRLGSRLTIGVGTVMTADQVRTAFDAGAQFIVAPNTDRSVVETAKKLDLLCSPGALTPTEIAYAYSLGADIVKLFPANSMGFSYIKSIRGPLNHIPLMATGGITPENINEFFASGIQVVGTCPTIMPPEDVERERYEHIAQLARLHVQAVKQAHS